MGAPVGIALAATLKPLRDYFFITVFNKLPLEFCFLQMCILSVKMCIYLFVLIHAVFTDISFSFNRKLKSSNLG